MIRDNPMMKKLLETGEEQMGKLTQQLLSNEKFIAAIQSLVGRTLAAKGTLDKSLRTALSAMNLPSTADFEKLSSKVDEIEQLLGKIEQKLDGMNKPRP